MSLMPPVIPSIKELEYSEHNRVHKYVYISTNILELIKAVKIYLILFGDIKNPGDGPVWVFNCNISKIGAFKLDIKLFRTSATVKANDLFCIEFSSNFIYDAEQNTTNLLNLYLEGFVETIMKNTTFRPIASIKF